MEPSEKWCPGDAKSKNPERAKLVFVASPDSFSLLAILFVCKIVCENLAQSFFCIHTRSDNGFSPPALTRISRAATYHQQGA